jgi:hypothetical protein
MGEIFILLLENVVIGEDLILLLKNRVMGLRPYLIIGP